MNLLVTLGTAILGWIAPGGGKIVHDVRYAAHDRGTLDVYEPERAAPGAPLVVFVYGGSWQSGEKSMYRFVGKVLASRGFVVAIPDYRVYPAVKYPDFLRDNAEAVAFARSHAGEWGADGGRLFLAGHSAGAYDVAMLALDRRWLGAVSLDPRRDVAGVIGLAGPYDFLPLRDETLKIIFGPEQTRPDTQPINHVDGSAPPMLLLAGSKDTTVDPGNTTRLAAAIHARGGAATARIVPGKSHVSLLTSLLPSLGGRSEILSEVAGFIEFDARAGGRAEDGGVSLLILIGVVTAALVAALTFAWAVQRVTGNSGWIDSIWSLATGAAGVAYALTATTGYAPTKRSLLAAILVAAWSLRLGVHIAMRTAASTSEDPRYAQFRKDWGASFQIKLFAFLMIQAAAAAILALSVLVAARNPAPGLAWSDALGALVLIAAVAGEGLADAQLRKFKSYGPNKGAICDVGLWSWSRHPNYFFEWFGWLAYPLIAFNPSGAWPWGWAALSAPAFMYYLLRYASGVPPTEEAMAKSRGAAFADYQRRVSVFFPLPPRIREAAA